MPDRIGVMLNNLERDRIRAFAVAAAAGFEVVHANAVPEAWLSGPQRQAYVSAARGGGVRVDTLFVGFDGQDYSGIGAVARTVGLLPIPELREHRVTIALACSDLAAELGVPALALHLGFFPPDRSGPDHSWLVDAVRRIAARCGDNGQSLHLETGQEPAADLLQFICAVDVPNIGVNFDPGNFLLYGTDDPLAALDTLGPYVRGVHCKDGTRPTVAGHLGVETPLGMGDVDFRRLLAKLNDLGYTGPLIIERECGDSVREDVFAGREYLNRLLGELRRQE